MNPPILPGLGSTQLCFLSLSPTGLISLQSILNITRLLGLSSAAARSRCREEFKLLCLRSSCWPRRLTTMLLPVRSSHKRVSLAQLSEIRATVNYLPTAFTGKHSTADLRRLELSVHIPEQGPGVVVYTLSTSLVTYISEIC